MLLVNCNDNKMVKSPGGSFYSGFFMRLTKKIYKKYFFSEEVLLVSCNDKIHCKKFKEEFECHKLAFNPDGKTAKNSYLFVYIQNDSLWSQVPKRSYS